MSVNAWRVQIPAPQTLFASDALGAGETEAIALAMAVGAPLLLTDDRLAREEAERRGLRVTGTIGVFILARNEGAISSVLPLLLELQGMGQWISDELLELIRQEERRDG